MSMFLDAAHPRDRKFVRECLPAASSSDSGTASDSDSAYDEAESHSQQDAASSGSEGGDSTQQPDRRRLAGRKRTRSPSPSSQDSISPAPHSRRRQTPSVMLPTLPQASAPGEPRLFKRPVGRPRKHPVPADRPVNGLVSAAAPKSSQGPPGVRLRSLHNLQQQHHSTAMQHHSSRAERLAQRRQRQPLQAPMSQQGPRRKHSRERSALTISQHKKAVELQLAARLAKPASVVQQSASAGQIKMLTQPCQPAPLQPDPAVAAAKPAGHTIVRSPFRFASRALRSAAQLLSLRSRSLKSGPVSNGTRAKAPRSAS